MSEKEYNKMTKTGMVQESYSGTTHVASPPSSKAFGSQAKSGSLYVEFDVPASSVKQTGESWGIILGPNTLESRLRIQKGLPPYEMPPAINIRLRGIK